MTDARRQVRNFHHPGAGRRQSVPYPKGRQVDPAALDEVRQLLNGQPRRRDLLIEHLHRIQDAYGFLSSAHLAALAEEMRLALAEVYEVATFYAHFDIVKDDPAGRPLPTVRVCDSLSCALAGADRLIEACEQVLEGRARVLRAPCMGRCDAAPAAAVGHKVLAPATHSAVAGAVIAQDFGPVVPAYRGIDAYCADGGYRLLAACRNGDRTVEATIEALDRSGLRGLGGAGFPVGRKWQSVRAEVGPRLCAINADEGEPGTFKDRHYLLADPHRFLEGALIAAWAMEAADTYIYLRDEYPEVREVLLRELEAVRRTGLADATALHLRRGAGAYICGEESAMLESLEGKRGYPRHKPPYPSQVGLFGRPTLVHNVETLYWVRDIVERGPEWFADQGRRGHKGPRSFSVSGRVRLPGVKLAPAGITARELIEEYCGGMQEGHRLKAYLPGGASGGILPASLADLPLDFGTLEAHGCFIGSAAVIVLSDRDDIAGAARNLMRFFEDESCGQCTPCRAGTEKAVRLMAGNGWDRGLLEDLSQVMADASICGLGQAAPNPLRCLFRYFPDDVPQ